MIPIVFGILLACSLLGGVVLYTRHEEKRATDKMRKEYLASCAQYNAEYDDLPLQDLGELYIALGGLDMEENEYGYEYTSCSTGQIIHYSLTLQ